MIKINQEDSVMINKSALDRGLFTSTYYKSYRDQCSKNHSTGEEEIFTKPDPSTTAHMKPYNYDKLGEDGFVPKNTYVDGNDVLIGKVMPHKIHGQIHPRDTSHSMKANDEGYIDMNYEGINSEAYKFAKVRLRKYRKPVVGDKVASRFKRVSVRISKIRASSVMLQHCLLREPLPKSTQLPLSCGNMQEEQ